MYMLRETLDVDDKLRNCESTSCNVVFMIFVIFTSARHILGRTFYKYYLKNDLVICVALHNAATTNLNESLKRITNPGVKHIKK